MDGICRIVEVTHIFLCALQWTLRTDEIPSFFILPYHFSPHVLSLSPP